MRALVIEDEPAIRTSLVQQLSLAGFAVDSAADGEEGLYQATELPVDIVLVDLGLPKLDGVSLIKQLRKKGKDVPVLILTARGRWQEKVEGLEAGADDYLTKPFQAEELIARVRALLRRKGGWAQSELVCGPITLNTTDQGVKLNGSAIELTAYEYRLLECLMLNAGKVLSKTELTEHLYAEDADRDSNVLEVFVRRLRSKLDPQGTLNPIETLRGRGYRFAIPRATA